MIRTTSPNCYICDADKYLRDIKHKIIVCQKELLAKWTSSNVTLSDDELFGEDKNKLVLVDNKGISTVIPSYIIYDEIWHSAFFINPLCFDWTRFDIHSMADTSYLLFCIDTLEEIMMLWMSDELSRGHEVLKLFSRFFDSLKQLSSYSMRSGYLER